MVRKGVKRQIHSGKSTAFRKKQGLRPGETYPLLIARTFVRNLIRQLKNVIQLKRMREMRTEVERYARMFTSTVEELEHEE